MISVVRIWVRLHWVLWLWVSHEAAVKVSASTVVSSQGSAGKGAASKLTHVVASRIDPSQAVGLWA